MSCLSTFFRCPCCSAPVSKAYFLAFVVLKRWAHRFSARFSFFLMFFLRAVFSFCLFDAPVLGLFARLSVERVFFFLFVSCLSAFFRCPCFSAPVFGARFLASVVFKLRVNLLSAFFFFMFLLSAVSKLFMGPAVKRLCLPFFCAVLRVVFCRTCGSHRRLIAARGNMRVTMLTRMIE